MANNPIAQHQETGTATLFWQNVQRLRLQCLSNRLRRSVQLEALKMTSAAENKEVKAIAVP